MPRKKKADKGHEDGGGGLSGFVTYLMACANGCVDDKTGRRAFIARIGSDCAGIHLENVKQPVRFLREMQGNPPLRFGTSGFAPSLVDDLNPARHYVAFVVVGYWLPLLLGLGVLYLWEIASFFRYRGSWSQKDVRSGIIGLRHGRAVAHSGVGVLAGLAARDLVDHIS